MAIARELPTFLDASHAHTTYSAGDFGTAIGAAASPAVGAIAFNPVANVVADAVPKQRRFSISAKDFDAAFKLAVQPKKEPTVSRRLVQVLIADPDDNVPLADAILYSGEQKLTDLTDQELFFEVDIKTVLDAHNAKRTKIVNKKVKERTEYLEPARIRDLRMVVVTVASF